MKRLTAASLAAVAMLAALSTAHAVAAPIPLDTAQERLDVYDGVVPATS